MNINSRYPVRHKLLLAGSGERAAVTLTRVAGYRRSPRGRQRRPIIRSNTHAPDKTVTQPRLLQCLGRPRRPGPVVILPLSDFHEVSRAAGPKGQTPKTPNQTRGAGPTQGPFSGSHVGASDGRRLLRGIAATRH